MNGLGVILKVLVATVWTRGGYSLPRERATRGIALHSVAVRVAVRDVHSAGEKEIFLAFDCGRRGRSERKLRRHLHFNISAYVRKRRFRFSATLALSRWPVFAPPFDSHALYKKP